MTFRFPLSPLAKTIHFLVKLMRMGGKGTPYLYGITCPTLPHNLGGKRVKGTPT